MITDIFLNRHPQFDVQISNALFVQMFNIYNDQDTGIRAALLSKVHGYGYSNSANEHIEIVARSMRMLCNERGYVDLYKEEYEKEWGEYRESKVFKGYSFDQTILAVEKLSLFEIIFRQAEQHLLSEIDFLERKIPEYRIRSEEIMELERKEGVYYHNDGAINLENALPQLDNKRAALGKMTTEINQRLRSNNISLSYHNGYFMSTATSAIEEHIVTPFWDTISAPKYKNVARDMLEALDRYGAAERDPAFYAAKALESMIKIVCEEKGWTTGHEKGAGDYISHLNAVKNGPVIINHERDELLAMFRIRNEHGGHGEGNKDVVKLTDAQVIRYIHSAMVWISNLSKR